MTARTRVTLGTVVFALVLIAAGMAMGGVGRDYADQRPGVILVDRNGYLHGVRYADRVRDDPQAAAGWPRDEPGVRAACRNYLDQQPRGFDREAFMAGCADAAEVPR
ncbi:hypothetical protein [Microcystis phage Mwe-JY05]